MVEPLGYTLLKKQPHLSDEGVILMRDKRVLLGKNALDEQVVIKVSDVEGGKREIKNEKAVQDILSKAVFSRENLLFPEETYFAEDESYTLRITRFIEQEKVFGAYTLEEKFFMLIREFEKQETFYANTFEHIKMVQTVFPVTHAEDYIRQFENFEVGEDKDPALILLRENKELIETRCNYLTHTDLAPSNFRVYDGSVYMIDLSSMHFANRYEGLARFLNWCILHDKELGDLIVEYIKKNRGDEEYHVLRLMRIYKAGFLVNHYAKTLSKTKENLHELTRFRLALWQKILNCLITDTAISTDLISEYKTARESLRSPEEFERQKEFNLS